ncbi:MAG: HAD-IIIA family hydrolase [Archaeoglobaceae archaeon]
MQEANEAGDREIKAIIFDMDNTLLEFFEAKFKACEAVIEYLGEGDGEELVSYFFRGEHGFEDHQNIRDYLQELGLNGEHGECCRIYEEVKLKNIWPYPGVRETLGELKKMGLRLAVVTDAFNGHAVSRLRKVGLDQFFDEVVSADMTGRRKPEPDSIELVLERLGVGVEDCLMVGDSLNRDIEAGNRLGMMTIYAAYGDRRFKGENGADFVLREFEGLLDLLKVENEIK